MAGAEVWWQTPRAGRLLTVDAPLLGSSRADPFSLRFAPQRFLRALNATSSLPSHVALFDTTLVRIHRHDGAGFTAALGYRECARFLHALTSSSHGSMRDVVVLCREPAPRAALARGGGP